MKKERKWKKEIKIINQIKDEIWYPKELIDQHTKDKINKG